MFKKLFKTDIKSLIVLYEITLFILTIFAISSIFIKHPILHTIDKIVYIVFFIDVIIRLYYADNKKEFFKKNIFDFIAIIPFEGYFAFAKIIRLAIISKRYIKSPSDTLKNKGLTNALIFVTIMIMTLSVPIFIIEPGIKTYQDAIWWAIVTTTTVGYGDLSPETNIGRLIAAFLMLSGIGIIGLLTSSLATIFIKEEETKDPVIKFLKAEIDRLDVMSDKEIDRFCMVVRTYRDDFEDIYKHDLDKVRKDLQSSKHIEENDH